MKKVILVTGASSGIGKDAALQLIKEGHTVYGAARRVEKMQDIIDVGGQAIQMDITIDEDITTCVNKIIDEQGRIDVLVNNAGYAIYGSVEETTIKDARRQFEVNIFGLARITQLVTPQMRAQQSGTIINISSVGGKIFTPMGAWYHATKHALEGWSDCLRLELKPFGIDVVVVEPGAIATEFGDVMTQPMVDRSGDGPYAEMVKMLVKATQENYSKPGASSPPSVISDVISKAINSPKPKTRYAAGKWAKFLLFFRRYFSDRFFERLIMSQLK
ncbi:MAG: oxidoreductase [Bacteroidota bacterium]